MQTPTDDKKTISFRIEAGKLAALDRLAEAQTRDRTSLLSQAVDAYWKFGSGRLTISKKGCAKPMRGWERTMKP